MKNKLNYLSLLISCVFVACAPIKPVVDIMPIPAKPESSLPIVRTADKEVNTLIIQNNDLSKKLETQKQSITEQKREITEAIASAEKIKEKALAQVAITEIEAIDLIDQLNQIDARNMFLETANSELAKVNQEQDKTLRIVKDTLSAAEAQIALVEADANNIRERLKSTNDVLVNKNTEIEKLKANVSKAEQKAAKAGVYRNWILGLVGAFVLYITLRTILTIYFPLSKFKL